MRKWPIIAIIPLLAVLLAVGGGEVQADDCDAIVTVPASIQTVIDANPEGTVCLDDSGGVFAQQVVFDAADSGIKLMPELGDTPVMDGVSLVPAIPANTHAINLLGGVEEVTIIGLEIKNYSGGFPDPGDDGSSAIFAGDGPTAEISVQHNYLHNNGGSAVRVWSDGDFVHHHWLVEHNYLTGNGGGIGFINTSHSKIHDNFLRVHTEDVIQVEARNSTGGGELTISEVVVRKNDVIGSGLPGQDNTGIFVRARVDELNGTRGTARLTGVLVVGNYAHGNGEGISLEARDQGATLDESRLTNNTLVNNIEVGIRISARDAGILTKNTVDHNTTTGNGESGIFIQARDLGTITRNKVAENTAAGNGENGLFILARDSGTIVENQVESNLAVNNSHHGINILASQSGIISQNKVSGNLAHDNTFLGLWIHANPLGVLTENHIVRNVAGSNAIHGIELSAALQVLQWAIISRTTKRITTPSLA